MIKCLKVTAIINEEKVHEMQNEEKAKKTQNELGNECEGRQ